MAGDVLLWSNCLVSRPSAVKKGTAKRLEEAEDAVKVRTVLLPSIWRGASAKAGSGMLVLSSGMFWAWSPRERGDGADGSSLAPATPEPKVFASALANICEFK